MDQPTSSYTCCVVVPRHHSALSTAFLQSQGFWRRLLREANIDNCSVISDPASNGRASSPLRQHDHCCNVLILQCHSEGVLWRGLMPLLMSMPMQSLESPTKSSIGSEVNDHNNSATGNMFENDYGHDESKRQNKHQYCGATYSQARKDETASLSAFSILVNHFQHHIRQITISDNPAADGSPVYEDNNDTFDWSTRRFNYHSNDPNNNNTAPTSTILLLLPPNPHLNLPYYSRPPSTSPLSLFTLRLICHENTLIQLTSLSAYISTLGGGFFLCQYLSTAISLARQQCFIALIRGDRDMAFKCRINEGYCYIHGGKLNKGKKVIRRVLENVTRLQLEQGLESENDLLPHHTKEKELSELTVIRNMCLSALRFANQIRDNVGSCLRDDNDGDGGQEESLHNNSLDEQHHCKTDGRVGGVIRKQISATHDDFQRIRIVRDRKRR
mmetsp:Transcript_20505/g.36995  ORF Transcript_20505/g.36995 Transcript_20505/m.36995 type:complete len:443 (+) Transcript_20505:22-1350(+)